MKCICKAWKRKCLSAALSLTLAGAAAFPAAAEETKTAVTEEAAAAAAETADPAAAPAQTYAAGSYVIGQDMPAGEYAIFTSDDSTDSTYSYCSLTLYKDESDERRIAELRFQHHGLITLYNGQHLVLSDGWAIAAEEADILPGVSGMYKVGRDMEPGTYQLMALTSEGGSWALYNDVRYYYDYIDGYGRFVDPTVITVEEGQYLELTDVREIEKIAAVSPQ